MCRALYAPMYVLDLTDQKTPAMDKLYYHILQGDMMMLEYLQQAEAHVSGSAILEGMFDTMTDATGIESTLNEGNANAEMR